MYLESYFGVKVFWFLLWDKLENVAKASAKVTNCRIASAYQLAELTALSNCEGLEVDDTHACM